MLTTKAHPQNCVFLNPLKNCFSARMTEQSENAPNFFHRCFNCPCLIFQKRMGNPSFSFVRLY